MKKLTICSLFSVMFVFLLNTTFAQTITLAGTQTKPKTDEKASFHSNEIRLNRTAKIIRVAGENEGFWIQKGNEIVKKFKQRNDPAAVGSILKPGTYSVYPILGKNQKKATISLTIKYL